ncbi:MAG: Flp pilus assembly complex ATPase component TadA [Myxococcota bacterium]|jgi:pilus assembly protein CpaF|nr:Flp pilus assembly complex ATPase component TadA [Myxococcota bacterium]
MTNIHPCIELEARQGAEVLANAYLRPGQTLTVGRAPDSGLRLNAPDVSRRHLTLVHQGDRVEVNNLSTNGATVAGVPLEASTVIPLPTEIALASFILVVGRGLPSLHGDRLARRERVRQRLVEEIDLLALNTEGLELRSRVEATLARLAAAEGLGEGALAEPIVRALADEALGLGPLEPLLADPSVSEIMVVDYATVFIEKKGRLLRSEAAFSSESALRTVIDRILAPCGRRVDESSPFVDARLRDGSRVHAVIPPVALRGSCLTVRKFEGEALAMADLVRFGSLTQDMADLLQAAVRGKANIVISGGTGSGKTTLLNVLSASIPKAERILTIEDAAELRLLQPHVVRLEARPANAEGKGQVSIRELVRNALRMRPDRIVVGECRGGEALDMLTAMNTGHEGSLTTLHANSPKEAISRLETMCLMAGLDLPCRAIREQIAAAVHLVVQQSRQKNGRRCVTSIAEVLSIEEGGGVRLAELYRFCEGDGSGEFLPTGRWPARLRLSFSGGQTP